MTYPSAINLPFNGEVIKARFVPRKPGEPALTAAGYWVLLQGDTLWLNDGGLYRGELPAELQPAAEPILFGTWDGEPVRLVNISRSQSVPAPFAAVPGIDLPDDLMTLSGLARQIAYWERMSTHCSRCGSALERIRATWGKRCVGCSHEHFPHIHPCVIVLVQRGDEFLLARKPEWPEGRYSLVAGFVDFGESLEECVMREVGEETGLKVKNIRYVGSQNWPFPSQMMAGFVADYDAGEIAVDGEELEDARWFSAGRMPDSLPPRRSIARWIIDTFAVSGTPL